MKSIPLLALACLLSAPSFANSLPDEINYPPHEQRYRMLSGQITETQSILNGTRSDHEQALSFIREMNQYIPVLQDYILNAQTQVAAKQREIPLLDSQISSLQREAAQVDSEMRRFQSENQTLQNRHASELRKLRPLEEVLKRKEQRIRDLQGELAQHQQQEREARQVLARQHSELSSLEREIEEERKKQGQMTSDIRSTERRVTQLQSSISQLESQLSALNGEYTREMNKLAELNRRVSASQRELNLARSEAQSNEQVRAAQRNLGAVTLTRDNTAQQVRRIEGEVARKTLELNNHQSSIDGLRRDQQAFPARISRLQSNIVQSERRVSSINSELSKEKQKLTALDGRVKEHERELAVLRSQRASPEQIRDAERKLNAVSRTRDNSGAEVGKLDKQISDVQKQISSDERSIVALRRDQQTIDTRISGHQTNASKLARELSSLNSSLAKEQQKLQGLNARVAENQNEVAAQIARAAERIKEAERKLNLVTNARDVTASHAKKVGLQLSSTDQDLRKQRTSIEELHRNRQKLTAQKIQSERLGRQLNTDLQARASEVNASENQLTRAQRNVEAREQSLASARQDLRIDEMNVNRQVEILKNLDRQISSLRSRINNNEAVLRSLEQQVSEHGQRVQILQTEIPQLETDIRNSREEIAQGRRDIVQVQRDERLFAQEISKQESKLAQLRSEQGSAQAEMNQRLSLYRRHQSEAQQLGISGSQNASSIGEQEGKRLAQLYAKQNGSAVGAELGMAQAKYWGVVRGELQGHEAGYAEGFSSEQDRQRGEAEGRAEGIRVAQLHAETNLKPAFFEEYVLEGFKAPLVKMTANLKSLQHFTDMQVLKEELLPTIAPLSPSELERSRELVTSLDTQIVTIAKDVQALESKARRLADASVTFVAPSKVPYGRPDCSQVYKRLTVFVSACENSYQSSFASLFQQATRSSYLADYTSSYEIHLSSTQISQREKSYPDELAQAGEISYAQGLKEGKIDTHQESFEFGYNRGHDDEAPVARQKARTDAANELRELLLLKPLLTIAESTFRGEVRAGEEVELITKLKNISQIPLNGPALIRITHIENAEAAVKEAVLNHAAPRSITAMPGLKIKILPTAKVGQKLIIKGVVELPGDVYKPQRQESFEISQTLSINPAKELSLSYDRTPKVKGVFRRNIHSLTATIRPTFENIPAGYEVTLIAKGANANLIELNQTSQQTGAIGRQESKQVNFGYAFVNAARGQQIELELTIHFEGKVLSKERIDLKPR
jgi:septal ring factor EnvC (AmiA/AmiB activator)